MNIENYTHYRYNDRCLNRVEDYIHLDFNTAAFGSPLRPMTVTVPNFSSVASTRYGFPPTEKTLSQVSVCSLSQGIIVSIASLNILLHAVHCCGL